MDSRIIYTLLALAALCMIGFGYSALFVIGFFLFIAVAVGYTVYVAATTEL